MEKTLERLKNLKKYERFLNSQLEEAIDATQEILEFGEPLSRTRAKNEEILEHNNLIYSIKNKLYQFFPELKNYKK